MLPSEQRVEANDGFAVEGDDGLEVGHELAASERCGELGVQTELLEACRAELVSVGDGSDLGVRIAYATEETPLGTAGSVLNAPR